MAGEEAPGQVHIFGGDAQLAAVTGAHGRGDVVEIGHGADVDPGLRHGDDDVGLAEAERCQQHHAGIGVGDLLAHQILTGDAEMGGAGRELRDDLRGREIGDLGPAEPGNLTAVFALATRLHEGEAGAAEERSSVLLQPSLGGHGEDQRRVIGLGLSHRPAHALPPARRSSQSEAPTAGTGAGAPRRCSTPS